MWREMVRTGPEGLAVPSEGRALASILNVFVWWCCC